MLKRKIWFEFRKSSFLKIPGLIIVCFKHKERNINKEGCVSQCMRIHWEKGVTEEQKDKVLDLMTHEKIAELEWARNHPLWIEAKQFVGSHTKDIIKANPHLRKTIKEEL